MGFWYSCKWLFWLNKVWINKIRQIQQLNKTNFHPFACQPSLFIIKAKHLPSYIDVLGYVDKCVCLSRLDSFQHLNFRLHIQTRVQQVCSLIKNRSWLFKIIQGANKKLQIPDFQGNFSASKICWILLIFSLFQNIEALYSLKFYKPNFRVLPGKPW